MKLMSVAPDHAALGGPLFLRTTESMPERLRGLLGTPGLAADEAMVLSPCNMVHTVGMGYPIDIVFADKSGVVRKIASRVPAWRMRACLRARYVIELAAGQAEARGWSVGQRLDFLLDGSARS